jgi:hypothetical protein
MLQAVALNRALAAPRVAMPAAVMQVARARIPPAVQGKLAVRPAVRVVPAKVAARVVARVEGCPAAQVAAPPSRLSDCRSPAVAGLQQVASRTQAQVYPAPVAVNPAAARAVDRHPTHRRSRRRRAAATQRAKASSQDRVVALRDLAERPAVVAKPVECRAAADKLVVRLAECLAVADKLVVRLAECLAVADKLVVRPVECLVAADKQVAKPVECLAVAVRQVEPRDPLVAVAMVRMLQPMQRAARLGVQVRTPVAVKPEAAQAAVVKGAVCQTRGVRRVPADPRAAPAVKQAAPLAVMDPRAAPMPAVRAAAVVGR